jgi:hypothetical protein
MELNCGSQSSKNLKGKKIIDELRIFLNYYIFPLIRLWAEQLLLGLLPLLHQHHRRAAGTLPGSAQDAHRSSSPGLEGTVEY